MSNSLDYYERLSAIPKPERQQLLTALRDIVAYPKIRESFKSLEGYNKSLFRDMDNVESYLLDAEAILNSDFSKLPDVSTTFSFQPKGWTEPVEFEFDEPQVDQFDGWEFDKLGPSKNCVLLRRRVSVLIGQNGCGKSTLLARLERVAFAKPEDRCTEKLSNLGQLLPEGFGFTRIVFISYSAFDNFEIPGQNDEEQRQIVKDVDRGVGRFVFCGLRDIAAELRGNVDGLDKIQDDQGDKLEIDRRASTQLKTLDSLADEFSMLIELINKKGRAKLFECALESLFADASFNDLSKDVFKALLVNRPGEVFKKWSTGHKIVLHVIASITAHCERKSLVLFDEPEAHLHPPLTAALMRSIRVVLEETNALCIIATHSPVILQETLAQHVHIVERVLDTVITRKPKFETFGESVGVLTYDAFGLKAQSTYFNKTLERLVSSSESREDINSLFPLGLSAQAEAYVMALIARKEN